MVENYYCDIIKFYVKVFLFISIAFGFPIVALMFIYRQSINKCIIDELKNNITSIEAVKKCDDVGILFILFIFIQISIIGIGGTMADNGDFDNLNLEIENNL